MTELENKLLLETARKMKLEDVRNSFRQNVIPDDMEHISSIDLLSRNNKGRPLHSKLAANERMGRRRRASVISVTLTDD